MPYLDPYSSPLTKSDIRRLLRRTTFGAKPQDVDSLYGNSLSSIIDQLFATQTPPDPPLFLPDYLGVSDDPEVPYGQTWVNASVSPQVSETAVKNKIYNQRKISHYSWIFLMMHNCGVSIQEKMILFWHNHFVANNFIAHRNYKYHELFRTYALGSFKQLTKDITIDTSMLLYLSGDDNTYQNPNENYARELLELFTIGKGPLVGPSDYTNYTESDIEAMAQVLTGWRVNNNWSPNALTPLFDNNRHTPGTKTLSHRFNNATISEAGSNEYSNLIDVIFQQDECSRFIVRKIYTWFISHQIDTDIETNIIEPLAQILRNDNYVIENTLKTLISSEHFFTNTSCMVKSPVDLLFTFLKGLDVDITNGSTVEDQYKNSYLFYLMCSNAEQQVLGHPSVAGWKAYYQAPSFDKTWLNSVLIANRMNMCRALVKGETINILGVNRNVTPIVDALSILNSNSMPDDSDSVTQDIIDRLFSYPISATQKQELINVLTEGGGNLNWQIQYNNYINNPSNQLYEDLVTNKMKDLIAKAIQMSEFQIM